MKTLQLTENCYLLSSDHHGNVGLVFKRDDMFISTHNSEKIYASLQDIAKEFNEKLTERTVQEEKSKIEIFGFPVRHSEMFDPQFIDNVPTYKIKEDSDIRYVAGHWVLFSDGKYRTAFCVKESTITPECQGPFKDAFSAKISLNNVNSRLKE